MHRFPSMRFACALLSLCALRVSPGRSQENPPELPAQIELLETRVRFESNGDSRKEVHTRVHINNELGARQFARLSFDYNRSFQQIEFPLVRITHAGGGTVDILPSAISDQPNPAVINAPAYQDVRVKSVRILGLAPNDLLEYRVVTTTSHHPLAPDFWLDHTFDRSGIVAEEIFELDLPASRLRQEADALSISDPLRVHAPFRSDVQIRVSPQTPITSTKTVDHGESARVIDRWQISPPNLSQTPQDSAPQSEESDIVLTTYASWTQLAFHLAPHLLAYGGLDVIEPKERQLVYGPGHGTNPMSSLFEFVSKKVKTIDLPLGSTGFLTRRPEEVLALGYGTPEDKFALFSALARFAYIPFHPLLICAAEAAEERLPRPSLFSYLLIETTLRGHSEFLDPALEVAPFGAIRANLRGRPALAAYQGIGGNLNWWTRIPRNLPFASFQRVNVDAVLTADGTLSAKVRYTMRGDNELLLRLALHQSPKEKWREVAQLLALSDGFRGKITNVTASDPYATKDPFTVEYEITQPKFIDWSKKPVRIPALLPQLGLPDPPAKPGAATSAIDLGTPLDIETDLALHLPAGTVVRTPTGTSVVRDYATFASKYQTSAGAVTASRHLNFLSREVPADRAADYNAFVRAVQNDESQEFLLERTPQ